MRKKRSLLKDILFLSISSFIVVAAWVGFNIYHSHVTTTITPELQIQIAPIDPNFDTLTLEKLKNRKQVKPLTTLSNNISPVPSQDAAASDAEQDTPLSVTPDPPTASPGTTQTQPLPNNSPVTIQGE